MSEASVGKPRYEVIDREQLCVGGWWMWSG